MKKMAFLGCLILFLTTIVFAQEKVEPPIWNVGDKWIFTHTGTIEVLKIEQNAYVVNFSNDICVIERQGFDKIIFDKATMQRIFSVSAGSFFLKGDKRNKYEAGLRNIFNFPFIPGKQWENAYCAKPVISTLRNLPSLDYYEKFKILGWNDITIQGGKFKTLKVEVIRGHQADPVRWIPAIEGKGVYWYSPDVKYFVKCEYDPNSVKEYRGEVFNWELTSFEFKK